MTDMLATGAAWLASKMKAHATQLVQYERGDTQLALRVTFGRSMFEEDNGNGGIISYETRDYLFDVADLESFTEPRRGDLIIESDGRRFELMPNPNGHFFRFDDPFRNRYRVFTKSAGTAS